MNTLKTVKTLMKGLAAASVLALLPSVSYASGYDVSRFWDSGDNFIVSFVEQPEDHEEVFSVSIDSDAQTATFEFQWGEYGRQGTCSVSIDSTDEGRPVGHVYEQALELAANIELVKNFRVASWGGVCYELTNVEYREDITLVDFTCENGYTGWGQSVYVVGNTERLGNWDPANAVKLEPGQYPTWNKSVAVESNQEIEWKCIKRDEQIAHAGIEWESGQNNYVFSGVISEAWGLFQNLCLRLEWLLIRNVVSNISFYPWDSSPTLIRRPDVLAAFFRPRFVDPRLTCARPTHVRMNEIRYVRCSPFPVPCSLKSACVSA